MTPKMVAIQNAQRHPMLVEQKPDMIGAKRGPKTVVCELLVRTHFITRVDVNLKDLQP
jgi:hypothetical protein